ncbi:MAG: NACHT domain-containing protein, partial [Oscillochloris sp.]|nr:NACHT domain-containing protein [Oscillochloris sp.]
MPHTTIEIYIRRLPANSLVADARLTSVTSAMPTQLVSHAPVTLNSETLLAATNDAAIYGRLLSAQLFADRALRDAWLKVRANVDDPLQLRLRLDARADDLHAIRWETLRDPQTGQPIALNERVQLVRAVDSADLVPVAIPPRPNLSGLVVVANPSNLSAFRLAEVDVDGEVARACTALGDIPTVVLGDHADAQGRATMARLVAHLRDDPAYVILVAHGTLRDGQIVLWLEQDDGRADQVVGTDLIVAIERLTTRPLLMVLVSCQRAVRGYSDTLSGLGPGLARVGVAAVLGFYGDVAMSTARIFLPMLISDINRDGQIDRALAAARVALARQRRPWWQPVLWLRTDGRLWQEALSSLAASVTLPAPLGDLLARMSNVWRWNRFGQEVPAWLARQLDQHNELQDINLKPLKEASRRRWAQVDWQRAAYAYRDDLLSHYSLIQLFGVRHPVHLADVLSDIYLIDRPGPWQRPTLEDLRRRPPTASELPDTELRREGLALVMRQRRLFIFGQPGVGKTTFLKRLAVHAAQGQIDAVPIMVEINLWQESHLDLMGYLSRQFDACGFTHAQPFLKTLLEQGQAMLLFDGLDVLSVHDALHQRMLHEIREFIQEYGQNRFVITCRTAASEYAFDQFKYCELDDFDQTQVEAFINYWFQHDQQKADILVRVLNSVEHRRLHDLVRRPLLLAMLCRIFDEARALPQRRGALYEEATYDLLRLWEQTSGAERATAYRVLPLAAKRQLLADLAAQAFERGEQLLPREWLVTQIDRFFRRLPLAAQSDALDPAEILRQIEIQHGLLVAVTPDSYGFTHPSIHEYFVACYLVSRPHEQI